MATARPEAARARNKARNFLSPQRLCEMPRLQVFAVCQQVIINADDNIPTLVNLIDGITVTLPPGVKLDPNTAMPSKFTIFSSWKRIGDDEGKTFEQRVRIRLPGGEYAPGEPIHSFSFPAARRSVRN